MMDDVPTAALDMSAPLNPLGPAPSVRTAVAAAIDGIGRHPDPGAPRLRQALAALWHIAPEQVLAADGSTGLLDYFGREAWRGPVALAAPASGSVRRIFPHALQVPWDDPAAWPPRGLLVLAQPNAITGELLPPELLRRAVLDREGPVLIDESYLEYTAEPSLAPAAAEQPNLYVLRSFSQFHGLAGLRVGVLAGSGPVMQKLARRHKPWPISVLAEAAALAALADGEHARETRALVDAERARMLDAMADWPGIAPHASQANFICAGLDGTADDTAAAFLAQGILVRTFSGWPGLDGPALRVAVRTPSENDRFLAAGRTVFCGRSA
jgi:threonine-phosphate decarboxylase